MTPRQIPFLKQLSQADADALLGQATPRSFAKSDTIIKSGSAGDSVAIVLMGTVRLVAYGNADREVILGIRGEGELIGEMAAMAGQRRTASAIAAEDVEVGFLHADAFRAYLGAHPEAALVLIRTLVRRLTDATRDVVDLATQDSVGRVAKRLLELANDHGTRSADGSSLELRLTQDELASWTGATRETISRALRLMRQLGWVATGNRTITVLDTEALRKRAGAA